MTHATLGVPSGMRDVNPRKFGGLVPGWSRECPMGVPLIVHILTLAGPGPPLLVSILALLEAGPIFAIWCSFLLIIFYFTFLGPFLRA